VKPFHRVHPLRYAIVCAGIYGSLALLWILFSGEAASRIATTQAELQTLEKWKGLLFVLVTTALFFVFSLSVFKRVRESARTLLKSQQKLVQAERDSFTGLMSATVAHDVANLLTVLRFNTEKMKQDPVFSALPFKAQDSLMRLDRGLSRLTELADRLRSAGRHIYRNRPSEFVLKAAIDETI
jgi:signal transduction histidine kinase